ncbi:AraC family transcriptional regulator [Aquimarina sp. U1-2]|uniref:helix-turn-helix domain-containing protein n=1 Tax=Aquimarina sp. U1-2 TaxID=2823141 RepID=UPI001AECAF95|nr:helix-turn-helix domain-containing protein [Aquimarina sp. U1-2]MBP2833097.1 AraC family transcriptional regulator [Aquimarina sp. U1-2]
MSIIKRHNVASFKKAFAIEGHENRYFLKRFDGDSTYPEEPYRTETYGIGFVKKGQLFLTSGLTDFDIKAPALLTMGPNVIRKWTNTYKSALVETMFFTRDFFSSLFSNSQMLNQFAFFEESDMSALHLNERFRLKFEKAFEQLTLFLDDRHPNKEALVRHQVAILCYLIDEFRDKTSRSDAFSLSYQFKALAGKHIKMYRNVQFYADELNTTPKHLSEVVKREMGRTASQVLHNLMILEAKILLQDPNLTSSEVAYQLNFPNPSSFGKYFKKYAGISPSTYQNEILTS